MQRHERSPHRTHRTHTAPSPTLGDGLAVSVLRAPTEPSAAKTSLLIGRLRASVVRMSNGLIRLDGGQVHLASAADVDAGRWRLSPCVERLQVPDHHPIR